MDVEYTPAEITALGTLAAAFWAFSYFALPWATNRVKDWESAKGTSRNGSPAQIVWLAGAGILLSCGSGSFLFGLMYLSNIDLSSKVHWIALLGIAVKFTTLTAIILPYVWWYFGRKEPVRHASRENLKKLFDPHWLLRGDIWLCIASLGVFIFDIYTQQIFRGFLGIMYLLFGTVGIGSYMGIIGDLMPRAISDDEATHKTDDISKSEVSQADATIPSVPDARPPEPTSQKVVTQSKKKRARR